MLENLKNKYLEVEMEVALRVNQSTGTVRTSFIMLAGFAVAVIIGVVAYLV
jgi:hypothetical protein